MREKTTSLLSISLGLFFLHLISQKKKKEQFTQSTSGVCLEEGKGLVVSPGSPKFSFLPAFLSRGLVHGMRFPILLFPPYFLSCAFFFFFFHPRLFFSCVSGWVVFHTDYYRENGALGVEC